MSALVGVFVFEATWSAWSDDEMAAKLGRLRDLGVTAIVTETVEAPTRLIGLAVDAGLETHVSVPCFSAHASPHLIERVDVQPVGPDGRARPQMEWYTGLIPTHEGYNRGLAARIDAVAKAGPTGLILDFIRWPLHWETELRASTPPPEESSFDARSIDAFSSWLERRGIAIDRRPDAELMLGSLRDAWTDFKCDVITRFAREAVASVRSIDPAIVLGAFIVPAEPADRRRLAGQDVASLSGVLDVLYPMTYHAILEEPPELVGRVVAEVGGSSSVPVVPVVQVTAERDVADPWDWGASFDASVLGRVIADALAMAPGVVLFPFEGLDEPRRDVIAAALRSLQR